MSAHRFEVGAQVRTRSVVALGHTRLPRYLAGRTGTVVAIGGDFLLADERARGVQNSAPQPVYSVKFDYNDHHVVADLWEAYLEDAR